MILKKAICAAALILISIFACSSQPPNPNSARVTVTYNNNLVSERNLGWNSFEELNEYMQKPQKKFVVFGARWCGPCKFIRRLVNQMNFKYQIMWIDVDTEWGELLWRHLGVGSVPIMIEADELDKQVGTYTDAREIVMRLMLVE